MRQGEKTVFCQFCGKKQHGKKRITNKQNNIMWVRETTDGYSNVYLPKCCKGKRVKVEIIQNDGD